MLKEEQIGWEAGRDQDINNLVPVNPANDHDYYRSRVYDIKGNKVFSGVTCGKRERMEAM